MASAGWPNCDRLALHLDRAAGRADRAGEHAEQLVLALALRARRRRAPRRRGDRTKRRRASSRRADCGRARAGRRPRLRAAPQRRCGAPASRCLLDGRAEHQLDDPLLGARRHVDDAHGLAVAQHGGAVAERGDFEQPVRDEDHGAAGLALRAARRRAPSRRGWPAAPPSSRRGAARPARSPAPGPGRGRAGRRAGCSAPSRAGRGRGCRVPAPSRRNGATRRLGETQIGSDVEVGDQRRLLVDRIPGRRGAPRRANARRAASPRIRMRPASGRTAPVRIFTSVDLPAPFAPISACTSPGLTDSEALRNAATAP